MVCPCRVVLAGLSAFVAVFLIWHTTRESSQDCSTSTVGVPGVGKGKEVPHESSLQHTWGRHTVLDMFTGKFLWDTYQHRQKVRPWYKPTSQLPGWRDARNHTEMQNSNSKQAVVFRGRGRTSKRLRMRDSELMNEQRLTKTVEQQNKTRHAGSHVATCCCGALSVCFEGPPSIHFWCHCKDCQNWFGSFDVAEVLWPASECSFRIIKGQEVDGVFNYTENSDRHFCKGCGTRVYGFSPKFKLYSTTVVSVPSVTYQPTMHVFCKDAAWQIPNDGLPHYKDLPAEYGGSGEQENVQAP